VITEITVCVARAHRGTLEPVQTVMVPPPSSLTKLAMQIQKSAKAIDAYLEEHKLPSLSVNANAAPEFPVPTSEKRVYAARQALLDLSEIVTENVMGPRDLPPLSTFSLMSLI
jgi:hypothetical protein